MTVQLNPSPVCSAATARNDLINKHLRYLGNEFTSALDDAVQDAIDANTDVIELAIEQTTKAVDRAEAYYMSLAMRASVVLRHFGYTVTNVQQTTNTHNVADDTDTETWTVTASFGGYVA